MGVLPFAAIREYWEPSGVPMEARALEGGAVVLPVRAGNVGDSSSISPTELTCRPIEQRAWQIAPLVCPSELQMPATQALGGLVVAGNRLNCWSH